MKIPLEKRKRSSFLKLETLDFIFHWKFCNRQLHAPSSMPHVSYFYLIPLLIFMPLHLHLTVIVQECSKVMHCMVWPQCLTSGRVKEVFVKTTQTKAHRSPRHQGSAAHWLLLVEWDTLHSHQSHFFNSNKRLAAEGVNTTPSTVAWTGLNTSGNKHFPINKHT